MNLVELQKKLPWGLAYGEGFKLNLTTYKDFQHALLHVMKATGKLAAIIEDADHARGLFFPKADVEKYLADLVICALRMANTHPMGVIDLQRAVINRLESKNNITLTAPTCPTCKGPLDPPSVGAYSHFPKNRFCLGCKKFYDV